MSARIRKMKMEIEQKVRDALGKGLDCKIAKERLQLSNQSVHEFDIFAAGKIIGGVSTSPYRNKTTKKTINTGGGDRACAELLWLTLWPGDEERTHVLTDRPMAEWLTKRFRGVQILHPITIRHFEVETGTLTEIGIIGETND